MKLDFWQAGPSPGLFAHDTLEKAELAEETWEPMLPVTADADLRKSPFRRDLCAFPWSTKYQSINPQFESGNAQKDPSRKGSSG